MTSVGMPRICRSAQPFSVRFVLQVPTWTTPCARCRAVCNTSAKARRRAEPGALEVDDRAAARGAFQGMSSLIVTTGDGALDVERSGPDPAPQERYRADVA